MPLRQHTSALSLDERLRRLKPTVTFMLDHILWVCRLLTVHRF